MKQPLCAGLLALGLAACQLNLPNPSPTGPASSARPSASPVARSIGSSQPSPSVSTIPIPPQDGLVAYYAFEGETRPYSYPTIDKGPIESQDHKHDGYFSGPLTFSYFNKGVRDKAAEFASGTEATAGIRFDKIQGVPLSGPFSISAWTLANPNFSYKFAMPIVCASDAQDITRFSLLWSPGGPDFIFNMEQPDVFWPHRSHSPRPELQKIERWHHSVVTYDGKNIRLYLDGKLDAAYSYASTVSDLGIITEMGKCFNLHTMEDKLDDIFYNYYGNIDELRIYSRILSESEVAKLYQYDQAGAVYQSASPQGGAL